MQRCNRPFWKLTKRSVCLEGNKSFIVLERVALQAEVRSIEGMFHPVELATIVLVENPIYSCKARSSVGVWLTGNVRHWCFWEEGIIVCAFEHSMAMYASH
jgi:hypothetical protein